jgi:sugar lactone lactonase YvrE/phage tail protein X
MKLKLSILFLIVCKLTSYAQTTSIGEWRTHMPYQQAIEVLENGNKLYAICNSGVFTLDLSDSSMNVITKVDGLSDVKIKTAALDPLSGAILIAYENTNIDIIKNNEIINIDDIFKKEIIGIKSIYSVDCINGIAYINCGFGTVLYDFAKNEIKDTYYLGANGANLAVYNVAKIDNKIYAATDSGVLEANYNNPNLANYQNWLRHDTSKRFPLNTAVYTLVAFNNQLFTKFKDSIKIYNGTYWQTAASIFPANVRKMRVDNDRLLVIENVSVRTYKPDLAAEIIYYTPNFIGSTFSALYDNSNNLWIADYIRGLVRFTVTEGVTSNYFPNGPYETIARRLAINNDKLIVASGTVGDNFSNKFTRNGIYRYENQKWQNRNFLNRTELDSLYDFIVVAIDPISGREYYGTFWKGLAEFNNGEYVRNYSYHNSTIGEALGNDGQYRITGIAFDSKNQLWVTNYWAEKPVSVRKANGQWQSFEFPGVFQELKYVSDITIDRNDQKWVCIPRSNNILVFKENTNGTLTYKKLGVGEGAGNLPKEATEVLCITEEKEGKIWVGTNKGLTVFYNPSIILTTTNIDAQPIKIVDGEFVQSLLENETITCIKVDGANRKWVGTTNGAWLFSEDGTKEISYFNKSNSPLLSNRINDIAIDPNTGEVYFASDEGIISYRGDATEGSETNKETVMVFPNPVKETYTGPIAIEGLVQNADVKITDVNGKIVFHTRANGAQAIWYGKNFSGERVSTGVYLVFSTDIEGVEKMVNKILFVR